MDEFDDRRQLVARIVGLAEGAGRQEGQSGTQPFTPRGYDVLRDGAYQRDFGIEPAADDFIDLGEVPGDGARMASRLTGASG